LARWWRIGQSLRCTIFVFGWYFAARFTTDFGSAVAVKLLELASFFLAGCIVGGRVHWRSSRLCCTTSFWGSALPEVKLQLIELALLGAVRYNAMNRLINDQ
jgi:hypothetical protein